MLEEKKVYYYKYRFLFIDGHESKTCQPIVAQTTTSKREISIDVELVEDLHSESGAVKYAEVQIYRKEDETEYRLIDTIDPDDGNYTIQGTSYKYITYVDDGKIGGGKLNELENVATKSDDTKTEVEDRIVKANLEYSDRSVDNFPHEFTLSSTSVNNSDGDFTVPPRSNAQLYAKVIFDDNQESFHFPVSNQVNDIQNSEDIHLPNYVSGDVNDMSNYDYDDVSLYLRIKNDEEDSKNETSIPFNTIELNNVNVPTLETWDEDPSFHNSRPHILLGFKYIIRRTYLSDSSTIPDTWSVSDWIKDEDLDEFPSTSGSFEEASLEHGNFRLQQYTEQTSDPSTLLPDQLDYEVVKGQTLPYHKHVYKENAKWGTHDQLYNIAIYKLSFADALKNAVDTGDVTIRMSGSATSQISHKVDLSEYTGFETDVIGFLDTSFGTNDFHNNEHDMLTVPKSARVYLVLDDEDIYNDIDSYDVINDAIVFDMDAGTTEADDQYPTGAMDYTLQFDLLGVDYVKGTDGTSQSVQNYQLYEGLEAELNLISSPALDAVVDQLIYVGSFKDDQTFQERIVNTGNSNRLRYTGFEYIQENNLNYVGLLPTNIFESTLLRSDIDLQEDKYPNQIAWSQPTVEGSQKNNSRTFLYSSFLNISTSYGDILTMESFGKTLLVFCERGVAVIRVGEKLASQSSGDVYIDSSQFLSSPIWELENVPYVQKNSVVKGESAIYFTDGKDAWMFDGKMKNISSGAVDLDGYCVGSYDPENKEYRVSVFPDSIIVKDSNTNLTTGNHTSSPKTYAYSVELQEWVGPYTYGDVFSTFQDEDLISVLDKHLVAHNRTNKFDGRSFETVIESTANDLDDLTVVKRYRKFYLDVEYKNSPTTGDLIFDYASEYFSNAKNVDLCDCSKYNGLYRVGFHAVDGRPNNSRKVFWKIRTVLDGFVLNALSFLYLPTRR